MSAEHFETFLTCDMRTAPDRRSAEYAEAGTQQPRWSSGERNGWGTCYLYVHNVLSIAADTVRDSPMDGISGDHPHKREQLARVIEAVARATRELALDAACDGAMTDERWDKAMTPILSAAAILQSPEITAHRVERCPDNGCERGTKSWWAPRVLEDGKTSLVLVPGCKHCGLAMLEESPAP